MNGRLCIFQKKLKLLLEETCITSFQEEEGIFSSSTWLIIDSDCSVFIERVRRERIILEELKKLEKLKIVSEMFASISHEVRNPLTVTRGFLQLLRDSNIKEEKRLCILKTLLIELGEQRILQITLQLQNRL